jgi:hypothetical protein
LSQYIYASQILGILVQTLAKCSVLLMVERLAALELSSKKSYIIVKVLIAVWATFSFFTLLFQCGVPRPWEFTKTKCAAEGKLTYLVVAGSVATDAVLATFFIPVIWKLQMKRDLKVLVSGLFGARLM